MKITSNENRILWTLRDLAVQHINTNDQGLMDSGYIRANRTAMEILVEYGHMELVSEDTTGGRWYQAKLVPAGGRLRTYLVKTWRVTTLRKVRRQRPMP